MEQEELSALTRMATQLAAAEAGVREAERILAERKEEVKQLATKKLPDFFNECNATRVDMVGGFAAVLVDVATCGLPPTDDPVAREKAIDWLCDNGLESIVKHRFTIDFGKGDDKAATECRKMLNAHGIVHTERDDVHYQTLSAAFREALEDGREWDTELFRVFQGQIVKIKKG